MLSLGSPQVAMGPACRIGSQQQSLNGVAIGTFRVDPTRTQTYIVNASGTIRPLGQTSLSGSVHGAGFQGGQAGGSITLTFSAGHSVLNLVGPTLRPNTPPPSGTYNYVIESGTGRGERGTVALNFTLSTGAFSAKFPA
jgi:hypothetical protein